MTNGIIRSMLKCTLLCLSVVMMAVPLSASAGRITGSTPVWYDGGNRGHIDNCRRLKKNPAHKTTYAEMLKKGGSLCSRCPGSELNKDRESGEANKKDKKSKNYNKYGRKGAKARAQWLKIAEKKYDPKTKAYCDALWMRVHEENCQMLVLKDKKKVITLEQADKEGWRIGESGQSGRDRCCFKGYRRQFPEKDILEDSLGIVQKLKNGKLKWQLAGCHRFQVKSDQTTMTLREAKSAGAFMCTHCLERGPSLTSASMESLKKRPKAPGFTPPEGWTPKPFSADALPAKNEIDILIKETLAQGYGIQEAPYSDPIASLEEFMGMRFFFPVENWLTFYQAYRATGDKRILESLRVSARHYRALCNNYSDVAQLKAKDPEGMAFMYSMAVSARLTLQLAHRHPDQVSQKEIAEAVSFLKTMVATWKPICEGDDNLDPSMGIPKPLAGDFRRRAFNRALNGIGTLAMAAAALKDLQTLRNTTEYQSQINRYRKCVQEYIKNWKKVGCLYTESDGKKYFYYPYSATDKGKTVNGFKLFGSEDQGHFSHSLQGVSLIYDAMLDVGVDDDFMTAIANSVYHNSYTKNGSIQCPSADKKRPMSRHPFGAPRDRFYMLEAFKNGIIDGQCSKLSKSKKASKHSGYSARLKILHAQYLKAARKDPGLVYLGENK